MKGLTKAKVGIVVEEADDDRLLKISGSVSMHVVLTVSKDEVSRYKKPVNLLEEAKAQVKERVIRDVFADVHRDAKDLAVLLDRVIMRSPYATGEDAATAWQLLERLRRAGLQNEETAKPLEMEDAA